MAMRPPSIFAEVWRWKTFPLAAIVFAGFGASLALNLPGHFEHDSLWQLAQGRTGVYNTWHPPVMAWLLGVAARLDPSAPLFIVFDGALFFGGLLAFVALEARPRHLCLPLAVLVVASPLVLIYQGVVWKDVLFADVSVAGFAALAWAGRSWFSVGRRFGCLFIAFGLFSLAGLARQNGFIVPVCGAAALAAISLMRSPPGASPKAALGRSAAYGLLFLALTVLVMSLATYELDAHSDGQPENLHQLKRLQVFDLAGAAHIDPNIDLSILHDQAPELERFIRDEAAPHYRAAGADNLESLPGGDLLIPDGDAASRQWAALVAHRPALYLRTRMGVFLSTLLTPEADACPMVFVGIDPDQPQLLKDAGLRARYDGKDRLDDRYASLFLGTPVFSHLFYAMVAMALLAMALRDHLRADRRPELIAVAAMLGAALLFTASFFVISNACDYRYLYFLDVAAMAGLIRQAAARPAFPHH
jgi:hypothetical protein